MPKIWPHSALFRSELDYFEMMDLIETHKNPRGFSYVFSHSVSFLRNMMPTLPENLKIDSFSCYICNFPLRNAIVMETNQVMWMLSQRFFSIDLIVL